MKTTSLFTLTAASLAALGMAAHGQEKKETRKIEIQVESKNGESSGQAIIIDSDGTVRTIDLNDDDGADARQKWLQILGDDSLPDWARDHLEQFHDQRQEAGDDLLADDAGKDDLLPFHREILGKLKSGALDALLEQGDSPAGDRAIIGVQCIPVPAALKTHLKLGHGLLVEEVYPDLPAARAGIEPNHILLAADGRPLHRVEDLVAALNPDGEAEASGKLELVALVAGERRTIRVNPTRPGNVLRKSEVRLLHPGLVAPDMDVDQLLPLLKGVSPDDVTLDELKEEIDEIKEQLGGLENVIRDVLEDVLAEVNAAVDEATRDAADDSRQEGDEPAGEDEESDELRID